MVINVGIDIRKFRYFPSGTQGSKICLNAPKQDTAIMVLNPFNVEGTYNSLMENPMAKKKKATKSVKKSGRKSAPKSKSKSKEMLLVISKTKDVLKSYGVNVASDALEGLNSLVLAQLEQAARRTEANGRKTVRPHDFVI